ncbi:hypothetical protein L1049_028041 [Liquidambar formosana]|uniref:RNase III domain-containing protein n=1 Tax=Liquidambar formosana TaxID=63359 RepID=A0AAP0RJ11_LIQFO
MHYPLCIILTVLVFPIFSPLQANAANELHDQSVEPPSPFSSALKTLQGQINHTFQDIGLLRRAMTHASYSEENNKALSVLGTFIIETSVSLHYLRKNIDISGKDLSRRVAEISKVNSSCAVDAMRLGLHKVIRVSPKTDSSAPAVVCSGFRAIFGAVAIDTGKSDDAKKVFWYVHGSDIGRAVAL